MAQKDRRVHVMNEVLNGIKVIKLYAWEDHFQKDVGNIRKKELSILKKTAYLNIGGSFSWQCAPFMVIILLAVYVVNFLFKGIFSNFRGICSY